MILYIIEDAYGGSSPHPHTTRPIQSACNVLLCGFSEKQKHRQQQVEFTAEITSPTFQRKNKKTSEHNQGEAETEAVAGAADLESVFYFIFFHDFWALGASRRLPGDTLEAGGQKHLKSQRNSLDFGGCFGHFLPLLARSFFSVFWEGPFSPPGRHLGAQGSRKGAKRSPKVSKKVVRRHLVERAKTMAGTVREAYGEIPGRVQEPLFSRARCEGVSIGVSRRIWGDFLGFGCLLEVHGAAIFG